MAIHVFTITTMQCDGTEAAGCPDSAAATYEKAQTVAMRLAQKDGWAVASGILCPRCALSAEQQATTPNHPVDEVKVNRPVARPADEPLTDSFRGIVGGYRGRVDAPC